MATSFDLGRQFPATAEVELRGDGTAVVSVALAEMGQGTLTALATLSAEALGLPRDRVRLRTQEAHLPYGAGSIGSTGLFSNAAAVREAVEALLAALARKAVRDRTSALHGCDPATLRFRDGRLVAPDGAGEELGASVARHGGSIRRTARTGRTFGAGKLAKASFGAVFTEVAVDPVTLEVSVERLVGAFACGRIVEPVIARNQVAGGMIWGLGQALFEESRLDRRTGRWTNANLAEALIATQADVPDPEVIFVSEDDTAAHPLGIKGLAEIGVVGPAPAIANAFYDATGRRLRSLPILLEERLAAPVDPNWRPPA
jgi:xanthine dehydrogenase YagR molybdenum-binding subunit